MKDKKGKIFFQKTLKRQKNTKGQKDKKRQYVDALDIISKKTKSIFNQENIKKYVDTS
jgi:hypothetical protein